VEGSVALVGAGPGASDLITLRGVRRLQEADVIYYDRLVDPALLDLARRDAERVYVGKAPGAHSWPQDRINGVIVAAARAGKRVVRLKCGDPGVFARGAEEAAAVRAAGIDCEIVPGVTAACGAAAAAGRFLTERGVTDTLVLTTGQTCDGQPANWAFHARPGVTLAVYMGVANAGGIAASLRAAGCPADVPVEIVSAAQTARELHVTATLGTLAERIEATEVQSPAMLLIRWPKTMAAVEALSSVA
jgi:uroporphyrin-III C-methyltransferase/precorrin-2 dehydrogenase/sirohydrochlorin ferrochelatase